MKIAINLCAASETFYVPSGREVVEHTHTYNLPPTYRSCKLSSFPDHSRDKGRCQNVRTVDKNVSGGCSPDVMYNGT